MDSLSPMSSAARHNDTHDLKAMAKVQNKTLKAALLLFNRSDGDVSHKY
jgi:hypothetical protein